MSIYCEMCKCEFRDIYNHKRHLTTKRHLQNLNKQGNNPECSRNEPIADNDKETNLHKNNEFECQFYENLQLLLLLAVQVHDSPH